MKKNILLLFLLIIVRTTTNCQTVQLSNTTINQGGFEYTSVLGQLDEGFIALQRNIPIGTEKERVGLKSRKLQLSYYNNALIKQWQLPATTAIAASNIENIFVFDSKVFIIYSTFNKESSTMEFYTDTYSSAGKSLELKNKIGTVSITKYNNLEKSRVVMSPDKKSFCIYQNETEDISQTINLITYHQSNNIKTTNFRLNYGRGQLYLNNYLLDNVGNFYLTGQVKNKENKKQKSSYLFCFISSINSVIEKMITDYNSPISDIIIKYNPIREEIVCGGIGVDNTSYSGSGIKLLTVDSLYQFKEINYSIQGSSLKELIGERNTSGISLDNYTLQDLILREDGGAILIAEAQYLSEYSFYDQFTQTFNRRTEYHFDNIIVFSVSPEGTIDWCRVIKKEQVSMDDFGIFSSFAFYLNNEELGIIYNKDSGRNFELMHVLITKEGQLTSKRINKSNIDAIIPKYNRQTDATEICAPVLMKRQQYLAKIEFE